MKKYITTIFVVFYLMSSLGVASVQHYCHMMQQSMSTDQSVCCCMEETQSCRIPQPKKKSCCADEVPAPIVEPDIFLTTKHTDCCETHHSYNQIETSPLSQSDNSSSDALTIQTEILKVLDLESAVDHQASILVSDPSLYLNLPLLI